MLSGLHESEALVVDWVPDCSETYDNGAEAEEQLMTSNVSPAGRDKVHSEEYGFWSQTFWLRPPGFPLALDCRPHLLHPIACFLIWTMKFLAVCLHSWLLLSI